MTEPMNEVCCIKTNKSSENKSSPFGFSEDVYSWSAIRLHQRSSVYICSKHPHCFSVYLFPLTLTWTPTKEGVQRETPPYRGKLLEQEKTLTQHRPSQRGERLDMGLKVHIFRQPHLEDIHSVHMKGETNRSSNLFTFTSQWAWMSDCWFQKVTEMVRKVWGYVTQHLKPACPHLCFSNSSFPSLIHN